MLKESAIFSFANLSARKKKLLGEGAWVVAGQLAIALATVIGVRMLTEFLPPEVYGALALALGLSALGRGLFCQPVLQAAYRLYPDLQPRGGLPRLRKTIGRLLLATTGGLVSLILIVGLWCCAITGMSYLVAVALAGCLVVEIATGLEQNYLAAARRQKANAIWQSANAWLRPLLAIGVVALLGPTPENVLIGYFAANGLTWLGAAVFSLEFEGKQRPAAESAEPPAGAQGANLKAEILRYALPLMPLALVGWITAASDRYLIGGILGVAQVGLYAATYGLIARPFGMTYGVVTQTLRPVHNQTISAGNAGLERRVFRSWLLTVTGLSMLGVAAITLLAKLIAFLLLAEEYRSSVTLFPWLAAGFGMMAVAQVFEAALYGFKATKLILLGQSLAATGAIAVTIPLIVRWGLMGAAVACPIYYSIYFIMMVLLWCVARKTWLKTTESSR